MNIGIDHGYSAVKTRHFSFPAGISAYARCVMAKQNGGIRTRRREASGVWDGKRIRRLTPRECLRLQGWTDDRIDRIVSLQPDSQLYNCLLYTSRCV